MFFVFFLGRRIFFLLEFNLLQELEPDAEISELFKDYTYTISIQTMKVKFNKVEGILHLVNFFYNSSNTTDVVKLALFYIRYRLNSNLIV